MGSAGFGVGHGGHSHMVAAGNIHGYRRGWIEDAKRTIERDLEQRGLRFPPWWERMMEQWRKMAIPS